MRSARAVGSFIRRRSRVAASRSACVWRSCRAFNSVSIRRIFGPPNPPFCRYVTGRTYDPHGPEAGLGPPLRGVGPHFRDQIEHLLAQIFEAVDVHTILLKIHVFPYFLSVFGFKIEHLFEFRCKKRGLSRGRKLSNLVDGRGPLALPGRNPPCSRRLW